MAMGDFHVMQLWIAPPPMGATVEACRKEVWRREKALGLPAFRIPAEQMAARALCASCRLCGRCERAI